MDALHKDAAKAKTLLDHTSTLLGGLQRLVAGSSDQVVAARSGPDHGNLSRSGGAIPDYKDLVHSLDHAFRRQQVINQTATKLISANYAVNLSNFCKTQSLHMALVKGQKQVEALVQTVHGLEDSVDDLNVQVDYQKSYSERLKESLVGTKEVLDKSIKEYRDEMGKQKEQLAKQHEFVKDLYKTRFKQDFLMDSSIFVLCLWIVNTALVHYPVHASLSLVLNRSRRRTFFRQCFKVGILVLLMSKVKDGAAQYGLHNRVGALLPYVSTMGSAVINAVSRQVRPPAEQIPGAWPTPNDPPQSKS